MNSTEPPDTKIGKIVSTEAISWESEFVDSLELFFARQAIGLPQDVTIEDYRRIMTSAFIQTLASSGASQNEIADLLRTQIENLSKTLECTSELSNPIGAEQLQRHPSLRMSLEEFDRRTEEWIKLHPVLDHPIDDSRESIYAGRGE